jgi:LacI family transcriptional regulator
MDHIKETTIYDIAKQLNISPATVSRGLKDHPAISGKTKKKIKETATKMGYRFNTFASNLRRQRTNTIGVIVPRLNSHIMSSALAGMEKAANQSGYNLIISQSLESSAKERANALTMFNNRVDGLIVSLSSDTTEYDHFKPFTDKTIPLFFFDRVWEDSKCPKFVIHNFKAAYDATRHLIRQGCSRITHITGNLTCHLYKDRLNGYRQALLDNGLTFHEESVICNDLSIESGALVAQTIVKAPQLPDGLFIASDTCAVSCMQTLKSMGIKIPEDIAIVGFNNDPITRFVEPRLTTIHYPGDEMGEMVAKNLISLLNGNTDILQATTLVIRSELIIRESSGIK